MHNFYISCRLFAVKQVCSVTPSQPVHFLTLIQRVYMCVFRTYLDSADACLKPQLFHSFLGENQVTAVGAVVWHFIQMTPPNKQGLERDGLSGAERLHSASPHTATSLLLQQFTPRQRTQTWSPQHGMGLLFNRYSLSTHEDPHLWTGITNQQKVIMFTLTTMSCLPLVKCKNKQTKYEATGLGKEHRWVWRLGFHALLAIWCELTATSNRSPHQSFLFYYF